MARKKLNMIVLHSWQECDDALRTIGENNRDIRAIEGVMNEQISAAKSIAVEKARPLKEENAELELAIRDYATEHKEDLGGRKSKVLTFGTISFRRSTKISLPSAKEKLAAIIARLRTLGMDDCINRPAAKVDKEALKKYSEEQITEAGATLTVEDVFGYEINGDELYS